MSSSFALYRRHDGTIELTPQIQQVSTSPSAPVASAPIDETVRNLIIQEHEREQQERRDREQEQHDRDQSEEQKRKYFNQMAEATRKIHSLASYIYDDVQRIEQRVNRSKESNQRWFCCILVVMIVLAILGIVFAFLFEQR